MVRLTPAPGFRSPIPLDNRGEPHGAPWGPRGPLPRSPQGVQWLPSSSRSMCDPHRVREGMSSKVQRNPRGRRVRALADGHARPRPMDLNSCRAESTSAGARATTSRLASYAPLAVPGEGVREAEGPVRVESLEPYFYYMAKKWGVKAYGIEFRETLRRDSEPAPSSLGAAEEEDPAAALLPEAALLKGVGVYAAQDIDTTQGAKIVLEVPLPLMVTLSRDPPWMFFPNIVPLGHPIFDVIDSTHPEEDWDLRLACLILLGLHGASAGSPQKREQQVEQQQALEEVALNLQQGAHFLTEYCDFLPPLDDCPALLLAGEEDLRELQDPELAAQVREDQERVHRFWEQHWGQGAEAPPPAALLRLAHSERHFQWAVAQAQSRGVMLHAPMGILEQDAHMLIPYADMLNHSFAPNCTLFWRKIDRVMEVRVMPGQRIQAGEELTLDCQAGGATNRQLIRRHGFSMTKNPWERVEFSGEHKLHKGSFLSAFDVVGYEGAYSYSEPAEEGEADPFQDETVIAAARCLPMWSQGAAPFVPSEEIAAAKGLQGECLAQLQAFETGVEEDIQQLKAHSKERSTSWAVALKYRIDRKLFLLQVIDTLEMYMERLLI